MTLPNFLVIGAFKSGTTSLYQYLREHPDIFMSPIKETRYFAYDETNPEHQRIAWRAFPVRTREEYEALFDEVRNEKAIGEASPQYLESGYAAEKIRSVIPDVKIIVSLRNPVDRAYSLYLMEVRSGGEKRPFCKAIEDRKPRIIGARYFDDLKNYIELFGREKVKILLFEDLQQRVSDTMQSIYGFLGVDPNFRPDMKLKHNKGGIPRSAMVHRLLSPRNKRLKFALRALAPERVRSLYSKVKAGNLRPPPPLPKEARDTLIDEFRSDVLNLQDLIERDLSVWLK